jgi:ABC-type uncharacterized transport system ATPase subunit
MTDESQVILRLTDVVKTFPGVRALDGVSLEVRAGEVHCLLGQNGAGKSTLIKVLSGVHRPDSGHIEWLGQPAAFTTPQAAMKAGIATIYQELDLVDDLSGAATWPGGPAGSSVASVTLKFHRAARCARCRTRASRSSAWPARSPGRRS